MRTLVNSVIGVLALLAASAGCSPVLESQLALTTQAFRGIDAIEHSLSHEEVRIDQVYTLRRERLDDAFDRDAREVESRDARSLDAEWIIEARRAYAAAIEAYGRERSAALEALRVDRRNVAATRAAIERLRLLVEAQLRFMNDIPTAKGAEL